MSFGSSFKGNYYFFNLRIIQFKFLKLEMSKHDYLIFMNLNGSSRLEKLWIEDNANKCIQGWFLIYEHL